MTVALVVFPCLDILFALLFFGSHHSPAYTCGSFEPQIREPGLELFQLGVDLRLGHALSGNLFQVFF